MGEATGTMTQAQIDDMFNRYRNTGKIETRAAISDGNKYICIHCKRKEIVINEWNAPWIFGNRKGQRCKSLCGHAFISLERLKILRTI